MMPVSRAGIIACFILLIPTYLLSFRIQSAVQRVEGRSLALTSFPADLGAWHGASSSTLDARSQDVLQLDEYIRRDYRNEDGRSIFLYVGYWKKQSGEHQAAKHSPLMCFPANGITISHPEERTLPGTTLVSGSNLVPVSRLLAKDRQQTSVYYYWFFSGNESYRDESSALFHIIHQTIFYGRSDGGIIEMSAPVGEPVDSPEQQGKAEATVREFAALFVPQLQKMLDAQTTERTEQK